MKCLNCFTFFFAAATRKIPLEKDESDEETDDFDTSVSDRELEAMKVDSIPTAGKMNFLFVRIPFSFKIAALITDLYQYFFVFLCIFKIYPRLKYFQSLSAQKPMIAAEAPHQGGRDTHEDEEEGEEEYVPDEELLAADQLPPPPPLPSVQQLEPAEQILTPSLQSRPHLAYRLGRNRYLVLCSFQGAVKLHIREFGTNQITSRLFPTTKGVSLDHVQVRTLMHHIGGMRERVHNEEIAREANWHLGKLVFATFNPEFGANLDLRNFFVPEKRLQATKKGVSLRKSEVDNLTTILSFKVEEVWPSLQNFSTPCFIEHFEHNDEERAKAQCAYCSPLLNI